MNNKIEKLSAIKLVGISVRTSNAAEMNQASAKIGATLQTFFMNGLQGQIPNRKNPGRVFAVYTDYESNENGEYTYFLGEEVTDFDNTAEGLETLIIPQQTYAKLTSESGTMPEVVIKLWQTIWKMNATDFGGQRAYKADFEIYDERSHDPKNTVLDIYIGVHA